MFFDFVCRQLYILFNHQQKEKALQQYQTLHGRMLELSKMSGKNSQWQYWYDWNRTKRGYFCLTTIHDFTNICYRLFHFRPLFDILRNLQHLVFHTLLESSWQDPPDVEKHYWQRYTLITFTCKMYILQTFCIINYMLYYALMLFCFIFKAIANESGINFISVKGPELLNMVCVYSSINSSVHLLIHLSFHSFVFSCIH